jgi:hypothetical protein
MEVQDRIVLLQAVKNGDVIIPKGTIGTIREFLEGNTVIQYKYEDGNFIYGIIPITVVRKATIQDLEQVEDYRDLIPINYHLGQKYAVSNIIGDNSNQRIGVIISLDLAINEKEDIFQLAFEDGSLEEYPQAILAYHSAYIEYDIEEFKSDLVKTNREVKDFEELYREVKENGSR